MSKVMTEDVKKIVIKEKELKKLIKQMIYENEFSDKDKVVYASIKDQLQKSLNIDGELIQSIKIKQPNNKIPAKQIIQMLYQNMKNIKEWQDQLDHLIK